MESRWNDRDAPQDSNDDLALCVYTSRLLGADENLVMHGGGNTSVKSTARDDSGEDLDVLYVKGSGWDLGAIEKPGFAPLRLEDTRRLAERVRLSDTEMDARLRAASLDPSAPTPSVEAILHAVMPFKFVNHTHADAVVTLSNTPSGEALIQDLFPDCLVLPYVMPGFRLAKQVFAALQAHDLRHCAGIILHHHGVFTYSDDGRTAYERMIELVDRADRYIEAHADGAIAPAVSGSDPGEGGRANLMHLARIRRAVSRARGAAQIAVLNAAPAAVAFASRDDVAEIATRGPITPDHVIRTKRTALICDPTATDVEHAVRAFVEDYAAYFDAHDDGALTMLDPAPRWAVWQANGTLAFGSTCEECRIIADISRHTVWAIQVAESLGGWAALPARDIFDVEYWSLEQAKLKQPAGPAESLLGKVAIVAGAAGGTGRATAVKLHAGGAVVVCLDSDPAVLEGLNALGLAGIQCVLTDAAALRAAIDTVVARYGGLDMIVAPEVLVKGAAPPDEPGAASDPVRAVLAAMQRLFKHAMPYLALGVDAALIITGTEGVQWYRAVSNELRA